MRDVLASLAITLMGFCIVAVIVSLVALCIGYPLVIAPLVIFVAMWYAVYKYITVYYKE